jgi:hypothetical protein
VSALDEAIAALEHLGGRLDTGRSAADQAVEAASDALDAAAAFGLPDDVAALTELHDNLTDATGTLTATAEQARQALARLLALRGNGSGGRGDRSASNHGARRTRKRRTPGGRARSRASQAEARRHDRGNWRSWGEPSDHMAVYTPKVAGLGVTVAGLAGMTQGLLTGIAAAVGGFAVDVAATMYQQAKAARRDREKGD